MFKIKDCLRNIVYDYNFVRQNEDFSLNILYKNVKIMKVLHRAHFADLLNSRWDIDFGLALYVPVTNLSVSQQERLRKIVDDESEVFQREMRPINYYAIDLGKGIKHGGYIITRIMNEVFEFSMNKDDFSFELFSDGNIPYHGKDTSRLSSN